MTLPALILGFIISTLLGSVFHLWRGGSAGRMLLYLILSWSGFWAGHAVGVKIGWSFLNIGPIHLGMALFGAVIFLGLGYWLSLVEPEKK